MLDYAGFQRHFLKRDLWATQVDICNSVQRYPSVAIKGCHGSGKTFTVSGLVPAELMSHDEGIVLVIAPTLRQVKTFWGEVRLAIKRMRVRVPEPTTQRWEISENCYAQGFSSGKGVNAQGFHGKRVLILADEAIGIGAEVWDAIEGIRSAGDVRIVKMCNPTVPEGPVYEDFTKNRNVPGHKCITISAFDTPNLKGLTLESLLQLSEDELDICPAPWLTRRRWVREMFYKWGPQNPRFLSRVMGEFPTQATDAVFQLAWIEAAGRSLDEDDMLEVKRLAELPGAYMQIGIDVAGPGDDETACCARIGGYVVARDSWVKPDALDDVERFIGGVKGRFPRARVILVGDTVGTGYHFMRALARKGHEVWPFIAGARAVDPVMFKNMKAEQYWLFREWMRGGFVHGLDDEDTKAQLSDVRYRELTTGQIEIEQKKTARERGSHSPDRAEAAIMAFSKFTPAVQSIVFGGDYSISTI